MSDRWSCSDLCHLTKSLTCFVHRSMQLQSGRSETSKQCSRMRCGHKHDSIICRVISPLTNTLGFLLIFRRLVHLHPLWALSSHRDRLHPPRVHLRGKGSYQFGVILWLFDQAASLLSAQTGSMRSRGSAVVLICPELRSDWLRAAVTWRMLRVQLVHSRGSGPTLSSCPDVLHIIIRLWN